MVRGDVEFHVAHIRAVEFKVLARLASQTTRFEERERALTCELPPDSRCRQNLHGLCAYRIVRRDFVVVPNVHRRESRNAAEIKHDIRRQRIRRSARKTVRLPHVRVCSRAMRLARDAAPIHAVHRAAGKARGALRREARYAHTRRRYLYRERCGDFIAERVVMPRARINRREIERKRPVAARRVVIFHDQPVAGIGRVFIDDMPDAGVAWRDEIAANRRVAKARAVECGDVGLIRRKVRELDARFAVE